MDSPYVDLDRPPLHVADLRRGLIRPGGLWTGLDVVQVTGSTNADLAARARDGDAEGAVLVAERQSAGRGRLGRAWTSPARAGLACSVLLRPGAADQARGWAPVPPVRYGWLPLLAGVALVAAVRRIAEVDAALKWPNDLLVDGRKCAGILAEAATVDAVVIGIGLNVTLRAGELPRPDATSLALAGAACTDRDPLLRALLRALADWYGRWRDAAGDPGGSGLRAAYLECCGTVGAAVRVGLPDGGVLTGTAADIDPDGHLVVATPDGSRTVAAGDVTLLR